ncbi:DMT family transporter [Sulfitobacter guttiformis]|uniref:Drug/metabolite transporter (DMT)-like permease n=1 Tax=Sulfitobacter guttiformis TaxID=74349 RepID=J7G2A7_9RHOB|nr:DMT family transporter [Sulfitobacter guttiformis]AFP55394.1 RhaT family transporter [Sulfitobacter guttiformis]KIN75549.1 RhaT family transporter [Sulfitobacter guttiformis KCTC 32187]RKE91059.1 drug/metabolite transporter (DMT)-like permease [Sulfitobacter guttiformis]
MPETSRSNLKAALIALCSFALFATHDVVVKYLGATYSPFQIIFFSVLLSFPLATVMLMRDATAGTLRPVHPWWTALRTAAAVLTASSAFYAFSVLPLAQVYAILFATPLLITVLAIPILRERVGPHRWFAVLLGLAGVLVVLRPGAAPFETGHLAALVAALGSATSSVVVRKIGRAERSAVLMLYPMVANFLMMAAFLPMVYVPMPLAHLGLMGIVSILAFFAGLCIIAAYRRGDAAVVAPMQYSQILWAAGYGILIFDEVGDPSTWVGAGIVMLSGLYIVLRERSVGASKNTPVLKSGRRYVSGAGAQIDMVEREPKTESG